jgi:hypothetical protein
MLHMLAFEKAQLKRGLIAAPCIAGMTAWLGMALLCGQELVVSTRGVCLLYEALPSRS